jgi:hypothetical protein
MLFLSQHCVKHVSNRKHRLGLAWDFRACLDERHVMFHVVYRVIGLLLFLRMWRRKQLKCLTSCLPWVLDDSMMRCIRREILECFD